MRKLILASVPGELLIILFVQDKRGWFIINTKDVLNHIKAVGILAIVIDFCASVCLTRALNMYSFSAENDIVSYGRKSTFNFCVTISSYCIRCNIKRV